MSGKETKHTPKIYNGIRFSQCHTNPISALHIFSKQQFRKSFLQHLNLYNPPTPLKYKYNLYGETHQEKRAKITWRWRYFLLQLPIINIVFFFFISNIRLIQSGPLAFRVDQLNEKRKIDLRATVTVLLKPHGLQCKKIRAWANLTSLFFTQMVKRLISRHNVTNSFAFQPHSPPL